MTDRIITRHLSTEDVELTIQRAADDYSAAFEVGELVAYGGPGNVEDGDG